LQTLPTMYFRFEGAPLNLFFPVVCILRVHAYIGMDAFAEQQHRK